MVPKIGIEKNGACKETDSETWYSGNEQKRSTGLKVFVDAERLTEV